jgi:hypothetical protein
MSTWEMMGGFTLSHSKCPFCGLHASKDFIEFMRDHDRADGRVCRKAAALYAKPPDVKG